MAIGTSSSSSGGDSGSRFSSWALSTLAVAVTAGVSLMLSSRTENCGIVGVVGGEDAVGFLLEGLTILRNRGYDSAGIASIANDGNVLAVTKYASLNSTADSIDLVRAQAGKHVGHSTGIGHTRWATHGGKTDQNAHPHSDYKNRVAVVHNGTINNSYDLKKELQAMGIRFQSETDTEVIAQLIGVYLDKGMDTKEATMHALARCDGSWGLGVLHKDHPEEIVVACNGSPMVIGLGQGKTYVASETSAFSRYTKNYIAMKDGELGVVRANDTTLDITNVQTAPENDVLLSPDPHPHFTIKECLEQPEAIARALSYGARMNGKRVILGGLDMNVEQMRTIRNMLLTGCGTSRHAAEFGAKVSGGVGCGGVG
jgi:glucosamine--fructose-6-phosphate aminotransferase (isomerizing)